MDLKEYLHKHNFNPVNFAVFSGVSVAYIYKILNGHKPLKRIALKIERATQGHVKAESLMKKKN